MLFSITPVGLETRLGSHLELDQSKLANGIYQVTLHLDVPSDTPGTSRRSSMSSITLAKDSGRYYDDEGPSRPQ